MGPTHCQRHARGLFTGRVLQAACAVLLYPACSLHASVIHAAARGSAPCKALLPPSHSCQLTSPALNFPSTFLAEQVKERYGKVSTREVLQLAETWWLYVCISKHICAVQRRKLLQPCSPNGKILIYLSQSVTERVSIQWREMCSW